MSDVRKHQGNPKIIHAGQGRYDENLDAGVLCGTAFGGWSDTCTYNDAVEWKKQVKKYYANQFLPAYEDFEEKLEQYELGLGDPDQQEAADAAAEMMDRYEQEIQDLSIKSGQSNNYYVSTVKDIVSLWDDLAHSYDMLKENLPSQVDPTIRGGKSDAAKQREAEEESGGGINWMAVAGVAGVAGLVFVGYKLWNE